MEIPIKKVDENIWEIPKHEKMLVPGKVFASKVLMDKIIKDGTLEQVKNVACLKGIQGYSIACPDCHFGYGFAIGGVAAFDVNEGIISPGGVGFDINCSVRMLKTNIPVDVFMKKQKEAVDALFRIVPTGAGKKGAMTVENDQLLDLMGKGARWMVDNGFGKKEDYVFTESEGKLEGDPSEISDLAIRRGRTQLGSLGSGNHFVEVQAVDKIFDSDVAKTFGISDDKNITLMIHCGSRGLGHQVASDFIRKMEQKFGFANLPDRQLINAPIQSPMGQKYVKAMNAAANFAFANKQLITHNIREEFNKIFGDHDINVLYDICHNIAKFEKHKIDGSVKEVCVHRKGATRSFGPGRQELPEKYRDVGQPVLIPGSMGTSSYLLCCTEKAEEVSFASTAHGAGRVMSRNQAMRDFSKEKVMHDLREKNVYLRGASKRGIVEEGPGVYKDVDEVVKVSHEVGIGNLVVRVKPLGVIKG
ncbi:MAG: RtcB family protein [Candidatus Woesearchaeota archaeon]|nr:RtcB family protein [Candidatus Woesearchaeota archaeon]